MLKNKPYKIYTKNRNVFLNVTEGHFATGHSHINYFIDFTTQKTSLAEAKSVAKELAVHYNASSLVDTILCLDGTEVIGTCLARELTKDGFMNMNSGREISIVPPERAAGNQLIFRDNTVPMIQGKHVLILAASVVTGYTVQSAAEAINYYNGNVVGIVSLFAKVESCAGYPVHSVFHESDLPGYASHPAHECPLCKKGERIEALVNQFGYSKL